MKKIYLLVLFVLQVSTIQAQNQLACLKENTALEAMLNVLHQDTSIDYHTAFARLSAWKEYPQLPGEQDYLCFCQDSVYGKVPLRVYIPKGYDSARKYPVILLLHGAVGRSSFSRLDASQEASDDDIFFSYFREKGYIIVRPYGDRGKRFDWVLNKFSPGENQTFRVLDEAIAQLKGKLNIDDAKVYAMGHSDGADGALGLSVYRPSKFAGFVAYNSMMTNLFVDDFYVQNTRNRPMRIVHSDEDALRPIAQIEQVVERLQELQGGPLSYQAYAGYEHYDKHLIMDLPATLAFLKETERAAYPKQVTWWTASPMYGRLSWLDIVRVDTTLRETEKYDLQVQAYDKLKQEFTDRPYYLVEAGAYASASCSGNTITIKTSRVAELAVYLSPQMVDLTKPVQILINGKSYFQGVVQPSKKLMVEQFRQEYDREALWARVMTFTLESVE
jgi:predicted peptidase